MRFSNENIKNNDVFHTEVSDVTYRYGRLIDRSKNMNVKVVKNLNLASMHSSWTMKSTIFNFG